MPGLGKTMLVKSIGQAVDVPFSRIQFTPDMMPADIQGTNVLVGTDPEKIRAEAERALAGDTSDARVPDLWDGRTAIRITDVFERWWSNRNES